MTTSAAAARVRSAGLPDGPRNRAIRVRFTGRAAGCPGGSGEVVTRRSVRVRTG
jgi:hypothetical protein